MNRKQVEYQIGRIANNYTDAIALLLTCGAGSLAIERFSGGHAIGGIFDTLLAAYSGSVVFQTGLARVLLHREQRGIESRKEEYPLEHAESVVIDDSKGLGMLLGKTAERRWREWGTLLNAFDDKGRAVVHHILNPEEGERRGLVFRTSPWSMRTKLEGEERKEFQGFHHYHVSPWAVNFTVHHLDRYKGPNWINLLTFNTRDGPEVIGYNRRHTYIPRDRTKRELVRATPERIMEYLER